MKKRISEIVTSFAVDGLSKVQRALKDAAKGVKSVADGTDKLASADVGKVADKIQDIGDAAKAAEKAVDGLADAKLGNVSKAAEKAADGIEKVSAAAREAKRALAESAFAGLDAKTADRAVAAYRRALAKGKADFDYRDKRSGVSLDADQLRQLDRLRRQDLSGFDERAVKRAAQAYEDAIAKGEGIASFQDPKTFAAFDFDQLEAATRVAAKLKQEEAAAADEAKALADEQAKAAKEATVGELAAKGWAKALLAAARASRAVKKAAATRPSDVGRAVVAGVRKDVDPALAAIRSAASIRPADVKNAAIASVRKDLASAVVAARDLGRAVVDFKPAPAWREFVAGLRKDLATLLVGLKAVQAAFDAAFRAAVSGALKVGAAIAKISFAGALLGGKGTFRGLVTGANGAVSAVRGISAAGLVAGRGIVSGMRIATASILKATKMTARLGAGLSGLYVAKVAGTAGFALDAAGDAIQDSDEIRRVAALTGMDPKQVDMMKRAGAAAGIQDTDVGQIMSGFISAMKDATDADSDIGKAFAKLGVKVTDNTTATDENTDALDPKKKKLKKYEGTAGIGGKALYYDPTIGNGAQTFGLGGLMPGTSAPSPVEDGEDKKKKKKEKDDDTTAKGKPLPTGATFFDFLNKANKLSPEARAQLFVQVFGEDDAMKVAEFSDALKNGGLDQFSKNLVTPEQLAAMKAWKVSLAELGNTWLWLKRVLTVALQPLFSKWAGFLKKVMEDFGPRILNDYVVKGLQRMSVRLEDVIGQITSVDGWNKLDAILKRVGLYLGDVVQIVVELGRAFLQAFNGMAGTAVDKTVVGFLDAVDVALGKIFVFANDGRATAFFKELFRVVGALWQVMTALAHGVELVGAALAKHLVGFDFAGWLEKAIVGVEAFSRDLRRIFDNWGGTMLTPAAQETGVGAWIVQQQRAMERYKALAVATAEDVAKRLAAAYDWLKAQYDLADTYVRKSWAEGTAAPDMDGASTMLGKVIVAFRQAIDLAGRLQEAIRMAWNGADAKDLPKGFEWIGRLRDAVGTLVDSFGMIYDALKPTVDMMNGLIDRLMAWKDGSKPSEAGDVAPYVQTLGLGALLFGKPIGAAVKGVAGIGRSAAGLVGLGGAAAAGAGIAAEGGVAGAAAGAGLGVALSQVAVALGALALAAWGTKKVFDSWSESLSGLKDWTLDKLGYGEDAKARQEQRDDPTGAKRAMSTATDGPLDEDLSRTVDQAQKQSSVEKTSPGAISPEGTIVVGSAKVDLEKIVPDDGTTSFGAFKSIPGGADLTRQIGEAKSMITAQVGGASGLGPVFPADPAGLAASAASTIEVGNATVNVDGQPLAGATFVFPGHPPVKALGTSSGLRDLANAINSRIGN